PGDLVTEEVPQGDDEEVADGVPVQRPVRAEAALEDVPPGLAPLGVVAERRPRHPHAPGREHAELVAQTAGGAAVVGDRDDGGEVPAHVPQRPQGGGQAVAAAEGDGTGSPTGSSAELARVEGHSRPTSRWTVRTRSPWERRPSAMASETATERCRPPVQPTAIVT